MIERLHQIKEIELLISYIDPHDNDLLPINNDDNFVRALTTARPLIRLIIQRKGMIKTKKKRMLNSLNLIIYRFWDNQRNI